MGAGGLNFFPAWRSPDYYFFLDDVRKYPDAWLYVVWSRRGPGKTYSFLRSMYENGVKFAYLKRTIKDVAMICSGGKYGIDLSPFSPVNRDAGCRVVPKLIADGIGGFYDADEEGKPAGAPVAYILAMNAIKEIKGFDLSDIDFMCLDEFIPQAGEVVSRDEGEKLLSIYMTASRDRVLRGRQPLKLVLFSNADHISTAITNDLEIVDPMSMLYLTGCTHHYLEDRQIMLHRITDAEIPIRAEEMSGIFKAMSGTAWGRKAFYGEFASQDFSAVGKINLKGYRCLCRIKWKQRDIYLYVSGGSYYAAYTRQAAKQVYDLDKESAQRRLYYDHIIDVRQAHTEDRFRAESYSIYDLFTNYRKIFNIS